MYVGVRVGVMDVDAFGACMFQVWITALSIDVIMGHYAVAVALSKTLLSVITHRWQTTNTQASTQTFITEVWLRGEGNDKWWNKYILKVNSGKTTVCQNKWRWAKWQFHAKMRQICFRHTLLMFQPLPKLMTANCWIIYGRILKGSTEGLPS